MQAEINELLVQAWKLVATLLVAVVAASPCAAEPR